MARRRYIPESVKNRLACEAELDQFREEVERLLLLATIHDDGFVGVVVDCAMQLAVVPPTTMLGRAHRLLGNLAMAELYRVFAAECQKDERSKG